jgi:hypothetical protein
MWAHQTLGSAAMYLEKSKKIHEPRRSAKTVLGTPRGRGDFPGFRPLKFSQYCFGFSAGIIPIAAPLCGPIFHQGFIQCQAYQTRGSAAE